MERSILIISNLFSLGQQYGSVCRELAGRLTQAEWDIMTTSSLKNRFLRPIDMLLSVWRLRRRYTIAQIDVFSGSAFLWAEMSGWFLKRLRKPFILILHGGNLPTFASEHTQRIQMLLSNATVVVTPSNYLLEHMKAYRKTIALIPNPVEIKLYSFRLRVKPAPRILYLRALHHIYNPALAVYALEQLISVFPNAHLTIVGPDKGDGTAAELTQLITTLNLSNHVSLVGSVPKSQVPALMEAADIFINPTNVDNTPVSIIEAMAAGLCIVSTNVGGIPYLLSNNDNALLVRPRDPEAMADAIKRILTEPALAERLSRNARAKAEQFDWSVILPQWETLLANVIENLHS